MISLKSLGIEYKAGAVIGVAALVLSLLIGLGVGNEFLYSVGRSFFFGILFAVMGFGGAILLKKYVPEVFQLVEPGDKLKTVETSDNVEVIADNQGAGGYASSAPVNSEERAGGADSASLKGGESPQFEPLSDYVKNEIGDDTLDTPDAGGSEKMGKHIFKNKKVSYEPKILASAIRTMMNKDQ
jgi:hypothetical protein